MAGPVDFNYFLARKYALLQQQADAGSSNAASGAIQANANATAATAAAGVDRVRAQLMPGESASQIGLQTAQAGQINENTRFIAPLARAQVGNLQANARAATIGADVLAYDGLVERPNGLTPAGAFQRVLGRYQAPSLFSEPTALPRRRVAAADEENGVRVFRGGF